MTSEHLSLIELNAIAKGTFFVQILTKSHLHYIELFHANSNKITTSEHLSLIELKALAKATFSCKF